MDTESSLPHSQVPATYPYPKPLQSSSSPIPRLLLLLPLLFLLLLSRLTHVIPEFRARELRSDFPSIFSSAFLYCALPVDDYLWRSLRDDCPPFIPRLGSYILILSCHLRFRSSECSLSLRFPHQTPVRTCPLPIHAT